jgi:hypothetical protein
MSASLFTQIEDALPRTRDAYYKLILVVGPARAGKTSTLTRLASHHNWPRLNLNLRLSEALLDLTKRQRAVRVAGILDDAVRAEASEVVLLDNIELLFAVELAQDPLRLLQSLSRNLTIIAAWPGGFDGASLTYAEPGHPEMRRYPTPEAVIIRVGAFGPIDAESLQEDIQ